MLVKGSGPSVIVFLYVIGNNECPMKFLASILCFLAILLVVASCAQPAQLEPHAANEFWLSTNPVTGNTGTAKQPFDCSTMAKLRAVITHLPTYCTIHFVPGLFTCSGITPKTGQKYIGSGMGVTTLQFPAHMKTSWRGATMFNTTITLPPVSNIEIMNLTIDCNVLNSNNNMTMNGIEMDGCNLVARNVRVINTCKFGSDSEAWGISFGPGALTDSEGNAIVGCQISQFLGGYNNLSALVMQGNDNHSISGTIISNTVIGNTNVYILSINGTATHDWLVKGNRTESCTVGFYGDTGGYTNAVVTDNSFINCAVGLDLNGTGVRKNIYFLNNTIELFQGFNNQGVYGVWLNDENNNFTNITIAGNTVHYRGSNGPTNSGGPLMFILNPRNVINGLNIFNNKLDSRLGNERSFSTNNAFPLNVTNNYDMSGNYLRYK